LKCWVRNWATPVPAAGLPVWVAAQPKFYPFKTEEEVQAVYHKLNDLLDTKLPLMFTLQPKAKLDLRLEPELSRATASDHYTAPAGDGSRPGVFWSVVNDPTKYGSTGMTRCSCTKANQATTSTSR
jgi:uncharacterized protein (DUF885 family)